MKDVAPPHTSKRSAIVIAFHQLLSEAMKYPSVNVFITVYHAAMKNPISRVGLLITVPLSQE